MAGRVRAFAPGRVNLIGDHTDYCGGWVLPMAIDRGTTVEGSRSGERVRLRSREMEGVADLELDPKQPERATPAWARYAAGVMGELKPKVGLQGEIHTDLPVGAGLSSSAAFQVALALALGFEGSALELAQLCQRAEQHSSGVPCGIMDPLVSAGGREGHALLIDCSRYEVRPVPVPNEIQIWVVHSGTPRALASSAYAERRAQCEAAAEILGPLRQADCETAERLDDPILRKRARHVTSENDRVLRFSEALTRADYYAAGRLMYASHVSLRDDFEVSTSALDAKVESLRKAPGVFGARLTGAGFGGCVVALARREARLEGWRVAPAGGAHCEQLQL